jgi:hypothetical protein
MELSTVYVESKQVDAPPAASLSTDATSHADMTQGAIADKDSSDSGVTRWVP